MIFGKIDFINLLPLHIYLKKYPLPSGLKKASEYKKGVPSKLNKDLFYRRVDAAVISSIESARRKYKSLDLGICANKRVQSVILRKNSQDKKDKASASSNALALALQARGEVIIGDRALRAYLQDPSEFIDLCSLWYEKTKLPFVFARFSCTKNKAYFARILKPFLRKKIFIPRYILQNYSNTRQISIKDIQFYLKELIYYKISHKEKRALKLFLKMAKKR
ncbi:MqnA/MqnD/SBP family protein [Campylobacter troglodytis]|uniref:MqnA/MqnD/SBP family protein n=1 Tax=Campylobacter troglodytis TaxID=654363 RepID=UPI00115AAB4F|nr:MqnA/MqnD/SBP family protein [Campylobacter troglodytis]TQR60413.1 menaquinone via futalosine step 1 [Campylobacter troglodytis]